MLRAHLTSDGLHPPRYPTDIHSKKLFALAADMKAKMAKQQQKRAREARRWKRSYSESEDESDGEVSYQLHARRGCG